MNRKKNFIRFLAALLFVTVLLVQSIIPYLNIKANGSGELSLTVKLISDAKPVKNATVILYDGFGEVGRNKTDINGLALFTRLREGVYYVGVEYEYPNGLKVGLCLGIGIGYLNSSRKIMITDGTEEFDPEFFPYSRFLYSFPRILRLTVLYADGKTPIPGAYVSLYMMRGYYSDDTRVHAYTGITFNGTTDNQGVIVFDTLPTATGGTCATYRAEIYLNNSLVGAVDCIELKEYNQSFHVLVAAPSPTCKITVHDGDLIVKDQKIEIKDKECLFVNGCIHVSNGTLIIRNTTMIVNGGRVWWLPMSRETFKVMDNGMLIIDGSNVMGSDDYVVRKVETSGSALINITNSNFLCETGIMNGNNFIIINSTINKIGAVYAFISNSSVNDILAGPGCMVECVNSTIGIHLSMGGGGSISSLRRGFHAYWDSRVNLTISNVPRIVLKNTTVTSWAISFEGSISIINSSITHGYFSGGLVSIVNTDGGLMIFTGCTILIFNSTVKSVGIPQDLKSNSIEIVNSSIENLSLEGTEGVINIRDGKLTGGIVNASIKNTLIGHLYCMLTFAFITYSKIEQVYVGCGSYAFLVNSTVNTNLIAWQSTAYLLSTQIEGGMYAPYMAKIYVGWYLVVSTVLNYEEVQGASVKAYYVHNGSLAAEGITGIDGKVCLLLLEKLLCSDEASPIFIGNYTIIAYYSGRDAYCERQTIVELDRNKELLISFSPIAFLTLSLSSPSVYVGYRVTIRGKLYLENGSDISGGLVLIEYRPIGSQSWIMISTVQTASDGTYSVQWMPTASGAYIIRATCNFGKINISKQISLSVIPYEEICIFSVISNSTLSELSFDSVHRTLSFTVSGPSGTTGYVNVTIAKTLVSNATSISVYLNGSRVNYDVLSLDGVWLLHFLYHHSIWMVEMNLGQPPPTVRVILNLKRGYNLISLPLLNYSLSASSLLKLIGPLAQSIFMFNASVQRFVSFDRKLAEFGIPQQDFTVQPNVGYFIYVSNDTSFEVSGVQNSFERIIHLKKGYNLVGWTYPAPTRVSSAFMSFGFVDSVFMFDATSQKYVSYDRKIAEFGIPQPDFEIVPGQGYFVFANKEESLYFAGDK